MKKGYICDYCGFFSIDKSEMEKHETDCNRNPFNKKCWTCEHYEEDDFEPVFNCVIDIKNHWSSCGKWESR